MTATPAYRLGTGLAVATAILTVWTTIVRDDSHGEGSFLVILGAAVAAWSVRFQAAGLVRAMIGTAALQLVYGLLAATAPVVAAIPGRSLHYLVWSAILATAWLTAAACFRVKRDSEAVRGQVDA